MWIYLVWFLLLPWESLPLRSVDYIKSHLSLTFVVNSVTTVNPVNGLCNCPFHQDKTPSMKVNEEPGYYYCFACGESGNVIKFISKFCHLSFEDSLEACRKIIDEESTVEDILGIKAVFNRKSARPLERKKIAFPINQFRPLNRSVPTISTNDIQSVLAMLQMSASFFTTRLFMDPDATEVRNYLKSRGISVETAKTFQLGYAPYGRALLHRLQFGNTLSSESSDPNFTWSLWEDIKFHTLTSWITNRALLNQTDPVLPLKELVDAGVALNASLYPNRRSTLRYGSNPIYDRFRHRLMIPIRSLDGTVIGFGGRELPENSTNYITSIRKIKSPGKYINTPTSLVFKKSQTLFGADLIHTGHTLPPVLLMVEGYFDVISLYEIGFRGAVASMGTALSLHQLSIASKLSTSGIVILLFDEDNAGIQALNRTQQIIHKHYLQQQQSKGKGISEEFDLNRLQLKAGTIHDAVYYLKSHLKIDDPVISKKLEKIKDCGDIVMAVDRSLALQSIHYLVANAKLLNVS